MGTNQHTQQAYPGPIGGLQNTVLAPPAYSLFANPVSPMSSVPASGTAPIQPQIAILATDPATLRALLSGSLAPQNLFQSLQQQQPQPNFGPSIPHSTSDYLRDVQLPKSSLHSTSTRFIGQEIDINKPNAISPGPVKSGQKQQQQREHDDSRSLNSPVQASAMREIHEGHSPRCDTETAKSQSETRSREPHPDVITRTRHCTSMTNGRQPISRSQIVIDEEEASNELSSQPRIGHPPRTLRNLAKPDLLESSTSVDEMRHIAVREPRKLNAEAFLQQSREEPSDVQSTIKSSTEAWGSGDSDTIGRRREPVSISAYYEKMKQNRGTRPLSAYRPLTSLEEQKAEQLKNNQTQPPTTGPMTRTAKPVGLNKRTNPVQRRAVTFATESKEHVPPVRSHDMQNEVSHKTARDPSIMTVAERARQWIEGRERDQSDTHRYSTCGFIDQDLMDCQEIVPVEDRVKMFDSGNIAQKFAEETTEASSAQSEKHLRSMTTDQQLSQPMVKQEPRLPVPSRAVASMKSQASKMSEGAILFPRALTGLQRVRMDSPGKSAVGQNTKWNAMSLEEKRRIFTRDNLAQPSPKTPPSSAPRSSTRRKTQPVTLDDLARANQIILARLDGRNVG
ncbi:hypothetical protein FGIG_05449 [Fasciola gigantica]|uniref:Supervillin n=1 Tax=Fasciola gigantica TaxID=46835 RepID=A0A504YZ04_FASGI|nr:hypothetical protein FGIG_05449 [Fasciola gigantica]